MVNLRSGAARFAVLAPVGAVLTGLVLVGSAVLAGPAFAAPPAVPAPPGAVVAGTPCTATAKACVDLTTQKAWLLQNGAVSYGPISIGSGGPGQETPVGTFKVQWKDRNHKSAEQNGTPMPYSVFFADGGVAFHGGNLRRASAGCVHLEDADAIVFYDTLKIGDQVQVHTGTPGAKAKSGSDTDSDGESSTEPSVKPSATPAAAPNAKPASARTRRSAAPSSSAVGPLLQPRNTSDDE